MDDPKILIALIAAFASLAVAIFNYFGSRQVQREIEMLKAENAERKSEAVCRIESGRPGKEISPPALGCGLMREDSRKRTQAFCSCQTGTSSQTQGVGLWASRGKGNSHDDPWWQAAWRLSRSRHRYLLYTLRNQMGGKAILLEPGAGFHHALPFPLAKRGNSGATDGCLAPFIFEEGRFTKEDSECLGGKEDSRVFLQPQHCLCSQKAFAATFEEMFGNAQVQTAIR